MQPLRGPSEVSDDRKPSVHPKNTSSSVSSAPLTSAQRTTLERIIVKIMAISSLKSAELWAGIRHQAGVSNDCELLASHYPVAEHWLSEKLTQEQNSHSVRLLLQQLTALLPRGNNRQAVSDFIRQQFGQTVLSSLTRPQLQQVLTMLQNGQMDIPQPQQLRVTDRTLLPAEHQNLQQQVIRLTISGGGTHASVWQNIFSLVSLKNGDPIPSRYYPLLTQYLNARITLSTQTTPVTIQTLLASLKQPPTEEEIRYLQHDNEQTPSLSQPLTVIRAEDMLHKLFCFRAEKLKQDSRKETPLHPGPETATLLPLSVSSSTAGFPLIGWLIALAVIVVLAVWLF